MKKSFALAVTYGLLQCVGASTPGNADFDDPILQAADATGGTGGAGSSRIDSWFANAPEGDSLSWYRENSLVGSDGQIEPLARYRDPGGSSPNRDTRGLIQIISDASRLTGSQTLTFRYLLNDADANNGHPHDLKLRVEVFGINSNWTSGIFDLAEPDTGGNLSSADTIPSEAYTVLLDSPLFLKTNAAQISKDLWREGSYHIDFGVGYDRVGIRFTASDGSNAAAAATTNIAIDKVKLDSSGPADLKQFQVLANSSGNLIDVLRGTAPGIGLISVTQPGKGTVRIDGDQVSYLPNTGESGMDNFSYTTSENETTNVGIDIRTRPNFLFILTDDQGWTTMEGQADKNRTDSKSDYHITPNLTRIANSGMRFSRGYAPAPNCSPSRYAILTGKSCVRLGFTDIVGRNENPLPNTSQRMVSPGKKVDAIQSSDTTITELLKTLPIPYATAHWGKWHLNGGGPAAHGFDESDGATGNETGDAGGTQNSDPKLVYSLTGRAIDFMSRKTSVGTPFYCQISHYAPHLAIRYSGGSYAAYQGRTPGTRHSDRGWAAMHTDLDIALGRTLDALDDLGIRNSTYLIYQSDNGAQSSYSDNAPLRGGKPEIWEAGVRVPTFFAGPGITADTQCDLNMMGTDLFPTIWEWATGSPSGLPAGIDGGSLVSAIRAVSGGVAPPEIIRPSPLVHCTPHYVIADRKNQRPSVALHDGDYKLVIEFEKPTFDGSFNLFHLGSHIGEDVDLSESEIAIRWRMWVRLRDYMKEVDALYPVPDPDNWPGSDGIDDGDADNDGINDLVEMREFLTVAFDGTGDTDQDGISDADEIEAGTDPLLPDAIRVHSFARNEGSSATFSWTDVPGRYSIESSPDLHHWKEIKTIDTNDFLSSATVPLGAEPQCFFRIRRN